jgi:hypothetical protein
LVIVTRQFFVAEMPTDHYGAGLGVEDGKSFGFEMPAC